MKSQKSGRKNNSRVIVNCTGFNSNSFFLLLGRLYNNGFFVFSIDL